MTMHEYKVLDAINIASTRFQRKADTAWECFQATAAEIAAVYIEQNPKEQITPRRIGATLRELRRTRQKPNMPLVERVGSRRWRMTRHGASTMIA
jgi:hypothetical protein